MRGKKKADVACRGTHVYIDGQKELSISRWTKNMRCKMFNEAGLFLPLSCGKKKGGKKKEFYYSFREQLQCIRCFKLTTNFKDIF